MIVVNKTIINGSIFNNATIKQVNIIRDIDYEKLKHTIALHVERDTNISIETNDERKKAKEIKDKEEHMTWLFSSGKIDAANPEHPTGHPSDSPNFPPYPSQNGAPSILPSMTWSSRF